jgi:hypothetical protein
MKNIRFGIMCEDTSFPLWQAEAIKEVLKINNVTCELLIINGFVEEFSNKRKILNRLKGLKIKYFLWNVYYFLIKKKIPTN